MKFQTLSRTDTDQLRHGVCPNCNKTHFLLGGLYHHEAGAHRRILCIHCLREFGVSPIHGGTAVILHFCLPSHRLASDYNIHSGINFRLATLPSLPSLPSVKTPVLASA